MDWIDVLLRLHVAALDPLGELDLLGGGQELVATGLAEEELEGVGGRLDGCGDCGDDLGLGGGQLHDLDPALIELAKERILLELGQLVGLRHLGEIGRTNGPDLL